METWLWIISAALLSGLIAGDSISPDEPKVSGKEGGSVTLRCNYETISEYVRLYWYRHHSNQAPRFILYKEARSWSTEHIPDRRYQSTTSRTSTELTITQLTLADTALYYCALERNFGNAITLDVKFRDDTPHVAPTLSILRPMLGDMEGPQVCLATGFYPDISNRVLLNPLKDITNQLLISPRSKSYTYATFSKGSIISSCSVEGADNEAVPTNANPTTAYLTTRSTPVTVNTTSAHKLENHTEVFNAEPSDNNRLSSYYLLINGLRHILTKTLVLNVLVVLRGLLA